MPAGKRNEPKKVTASSGHRPRPSAALLEAFGGFADGLRNLAEELALESKRQHEQDHPIAAAILDRIAHRLLSCKRLEEIEWSLAEMVGLLRWFPSTALPRLEHKARLVVAVTQEDFQPETREDLLKLLQKPGRPPDTRSVAVWALELRQKGHRWAEIEKRLLPHRRQVRNPGASIRREVQLLKRALQRYGIELEHSTGDEQSHCHS